MACPFNVRNVLHITLGAYVYKRSIDEGEVWAFGWSADVRNNTYTTSYNLVDFALFEQYKTQLHKFL